MTTENGRTKCNVCPYVGDRPGDVSRHIESKHIRIKITCKYCGAIYSARRNLEIHLRKFHRDTYKDKEDMKLIVQEHVTHVLFDVCYSGN